MSAPRSSEGDRFGRLVVDAAGLLVCHLCGRSLRQLGVHASKAHGLTADAYRDRVGLARGRGLVAPEVWEKIHTNAIRRMSQPAGAAFVAARDPARASTARLRQRQPWAP